MKDYKMSRGFTGGTETIPVVVGGCNVYSSIGSGALCNVFRAEVNREIVALKIYNANNEDFHYFNSECAIFNELATHGRCDNVINCRGYAAHVTNGPKPRIYPYLVFDIMDTSLSKFIRHLRRKQLDPDAPKISVGLPFMQIKQLCLDMFTGLDYLHRAGIIHGDIKPGNIFLKLTDTGPRAVIGDLGSSNMITAVKHVKIGTIPYVAPELMLASYEKGFTTAVDIWSAGLVMYEMFTGELLIDPYGECKVFYGDHIDNYGSDADENSTEDASAESLSGEDEEGSSEEELAEFKIIFAIIQTIIGPATRNWRQCACPIAYKQYFTSRGKLIGYPSNYRKEVSEILRDRAVSPRTDFGKDVHVVSDLEKYIDMISYSVRGGLSYFPEERLTAAEYRNLVLAWN